MVIPQPRSLLFRNRRAISGVQKRGGFFVDGRYRSARLGLVAPMVGMGNPPAILFPGIRSSPWAHPLPLGRAGVLLVLRHPPAASPLRSVTDR
jgi:hypothetical protein